MMFLHHCLYLPKRRPKRFLLHKPSSMHTSRRCTLRYPRELRSSSSLDTRTPGAWPYSMHASLLLKARSRAGKRQRTWIRVSGGLQQMEGSLRRRSSVQGEGCYSWGSSSSLSFFRAFPGAYVGCTLAVRRIERWLLIVPIEPQHVFFSASDSSFDGLCKHPKCARVLLHFGVVVSKVLAINT